MAAATLNRDLAALMAFLTWVREIEGLAAPPFRVPRERESRGRERWFSSEELARFHAGCPPEWWPFFATLFYTGARLGEAQGLLGGDVLLHAKRILIHEGARRVKTKEAVRDLPIGPLLEGPLASHLARVGPGPDDLVFPGDIRFMAGSAGPGGLSAGPQPSLAPHRTMRDIRSLCTPPRPAFRLCGSKSCLGTPTRP